MRKNKPQKTPREVNEKTSAKSQLELQEKLYVISKSAIAQVQIALMKLSVVKCVHCTSSHCQCTRPHFSHTKCGAHMKRALHLFPLPVHKASFFSHQMQWWSYEESLSTCLASCFQNLQQAFGFKAFQSRHGFDSSPIWKTMLITNTITTTTTTSARE